jgi:hypothetical protein
MHHLPDPDMQPEFYESVPVKRLIAWVMDTVLILVLAALVVPFTAFTGLFFFPFLAFLVGFFYRWITIATGSATWGMRLLAIEFRTAHGARFDTGTAFLHTLGYTVSFGLPILQMVSVVLMATGPRGQGLTDLVLGTVAVNRRSV